jgi:hypothetical protein
MRHILRGGTFPFKDLLRKRDNPVSNTLKLFSDLDICSGSSHLVTASHGNERVGTLCSTGSGILQAKDVGYRVPGV